jgi:hypothetical protein
VAGSEADQAGDRDPQSTGTGRHGPIALTQVKPLRLVYEECAFWVEITMR